MAGEEYLYNSFYGDRFSFIFNTQPDVEKKQTYRETVKKIKEKKQRRVCVTMHIRRVNHALLSLADCCYLFIEIRLFFARPSIVLIFTSHVPEGRCAVEKLTAADFG